MTTDRTSEPLFLRGAALLELPAELVLASFSEVVNPTPEPPPAGAPSCTASVTPPSATGVATTFSVSFSAERGAGGAL